MNSKRPKVESIRIGLASPECIKKWAERTLPNGKIVGQVTSSQTVNYKTLKPVKNGLFCERIFGPVKDFECSCGRKKDESNFCPDCDVEFTSSRVRRHRLGYIQLVSPVTHIWYLKGRISYISTLLDLKRKNAEAIVYCTESIMICKSVLQNSTTLSKPSSKQITDLSEYSKKILKQSKREFEEIQVMTPKPNESFRLHSTIALTTVSNSFFTRNPLLSLENKQMKKIGAIITDFLKNKPIKNYDFLLQKIIWETIFDRNFFLYYITAHPENEDIPISKYIDALQTQSVRCSTKQKQITVISQDLEAHTGAEAIGHLLANLNLPFEEKALRVEIFDLDQQINDYENSGFLLPEEVREYRFLLFQRAKKIRRLKLVRNFRRTKARPEWMVLSVLPVLPPDLRPIIPLDGDQVAISDLNKFYQTVLFRNDRIKKQRRKFSLDEKPNKKKEMQGLLEYSQRLLQEAVDALIENGKGGADPVCASNGRPLKSLSDILKGKKGRFRQNLLGKRVDYSGRSVIVVGPTLKIHECGLPKEMAIELFQPFLIRRLLVTKIVGTIVLAKHLIHKKDSIIWEVLQQVMQNHPVLLNRAPTLHRLGIQAFQPKLVGGRAILLHPLVCPAFNADFDGDQMAVHVPLSFEARAEAWNLMWSRNNILSPATGQPILVPSQDMVLGCYYLTTNNTKPQIGTSFYFCDLNDVIKAYNQKKIDLHAEIWVRWNEFIETSNEVEKPLEIRLDYYGNIFQIYSQYQRYFDSKGNQISQFIRTTPGRILLNQLLQDA